MSIIWQYRDKNQTCLSGLSFFREHPFAGRLKETVAFIDFPKGVD